VEDGNVRGTIWCGLPQLRVRMVIWTHHVLKLALFFPNLWKELRRFIDRLKMITVLKVLPTLNLESEWITVLCC